MLDTNMVSYIVKGKSPLARARFVGLSPRETVCLSAITEAEVFYGMVRRPAAKFVPLLDEFLKKSHVLPWGKQEARTYGELRAKQEAAGKPLATMDLLIAAHAISAGAILVTADKTFSQLEAVLPVVNWATELRAKPEN